MNNSRNTNGQLNFIGEKIKFYRLKYKYSYEVCAAKLLLETGVDINKQSIYRIEKGTRTVVDYEICAFAKLFKITPNELLEDYIK